MMVNPFGGLKRNYKNTNMGTRIIFFFYDENPDIYILNKAVLDQVLVLDAFTSLSD